MGEELIIRVPNYHRQPTSTVRAKVAKVGPQWVYFENVPGLHEPKFRVNTQHTENRNNYNAWYLTEEQHAYEVRLGEAYAILGKYKAMPESWSPLHKDIEKLIRLADAVREIMKEDEE